MVHTDAHAERGREPDAPGGEQNQASLRSPARPAGSAGSRFQRPRRRRGIASPPRRAQRWAGRPDDPCESIDVLTRRSARMLQRRHTIIRSMGKITTSALLTLCVATVAQAAGRPITANDLLSMERSAAQLRPMAPARSHTVAVPDLQANRLARNIWLVTLKTGDARKITATGRDGARSGP